MELNSNIPVLNEVDFTQKGALKFNFETLKNTANEQLARGGMPPTRPVEHWQFFQYTKQLLEDSTSMGVDMSPIYITPNHAKRVMWKGAKNEPVPVQHLLVTRAVVLLRSTIQAEVAGEQVSPTIAISYNERGLEVAFGENVWACTNMNIFGGTRFSTYGQNKRDYNHLKDLLKEYTSTTKDRHERNVNTIGKLADVTMELPKQRELQAKLFEKAVEFNGKTGDVLNITQNVRMTEEIIKRRNFKENQGGVFTAWDFTQAGTEHLKPTANDLVSLYPTIDYFNNFVTEEVIF